MKRVYIKYHRAQTYVHMYQGMTFSTRMQKMCWETDLCQVAMYVKRYLAWLHHFSRVVWGVVAGSSQANVILSIRSSWAFEHFVASIKWYHKKCWCVPYDLGWQTTAPLVFSKILFEQNNSNIWKKWHVRRTEFHVHTCLARLSNHWLSMLLLSPRTGFLRQQEELATARGTTAPSRAGGLKGDLCKSLFTRNTEPILRSRVTTPAL
jgi:hypothetical protein